MAYSGSRSWTSQPGSSSLESEPSLEYQNRVNHLHANRQLLLQRLNSHQILDSICDFLPETDQTELQDIVSRRQLAIDLIQTVEQNVSNRHLYTSFWDSVYNLQPDLYSSLRQSQNSQVFHQPIGRELSSWDTNYLIQHLKGSEILDAIADSLPAGKLEELESITIQHVLTSEIVDLVQKDPGLYTHFMNYLMEFHPDVHENLLESRNGYTETGTRNVVEECGPTPSQPRKCFAEATCSLPNQVPKVDQNCVKKSKLKRGMGKLHIPFKKKNKRKIQTNPPEEVDIDIASNDTGLVVSNIPDLYKAEDNSIEVLTLLKPIPEDKDITDSLCQAIATQQKLKGFHINGGHLSEQSALKILTCLSELHNLDKLTFHGIHCFDVCAEQCITLLSDKKNLSRLALDQCHFPESTWERMAGVLYQMPNLEELSLNDTTMKDPGAQWLKEGLSANTILKSVSLKNNQISDEGLLYIAQCIQNKPHLGHLSLANNHITDEGAAHLASVGHNRRHACNVDLSGNQLGKEGASLIITKWPSCEPNSHQFNFDNNQIANLPKLTHRVSLKQNKQGRKRVNVLVDRITKGESFRHIDLSSMDLKDEDIETLCLLLCSSGTLEKLYLKKNLLSQKSLARLTQIYHRCKNLQCINIERNRIGRSEVELFANQLSGHRKNKDIPFFLSKKMKEIISESDDTCLHLQNENLKVNCIPIMLEILGDRSFEEIKVEDCSLRPNDVKSILALFDPSVTRSICFKNNDFEEKHITALTGAFPQERYFLRGKNTECNVDMALTHFEITQNGVKSENTEQFTYSVFRCKHLCFVNLSDNSIGKSGCKALAEYLARNPPLRSLCLAGNGLHDEGTWHLCNGLLRNTNLHHLNLVKNGISWQGSDYLGQLLATNHTIQYLDISDNSIGDSPLKRFCSGLAQNRSLHTLCVSNNFITDSGIVCLGQSLNHNVTLCKIDISKNGMQVAGFYEVMSASNKGRITHCDISDNAGMWHYIEQHGYDFIPGILLLKYLGIRCSAVPNESSPGIPDESILKFASLAANLAKQRETIHHRKVETVIDLSGRDVSKNLSRGIAKIRNTVHPAPRFLFDCRDYKKEYFDSPF